MVNTPIKPQFLSAREAGDVNSSQWGTMQIVTPAIVGGALILVFVAYIIWQRRPGRERSRAYNYRPVHSGWATKIERMFSSRTRRHRVHPLSMPTTLDDSMPLSGPEFMPDFRRTRPPRSGSTDSQVPLTSSYVLDYTPFKSHPDSPPSFSKRRGFRWWWLFGSRPRQVKSAEPSTRWRIDDPDGASSHGHVTDTRPLEALEAVREDQDEEDSVIQIGENMPSIASTPMTQHFPEQARAIRGTMSPVPEHSGSSGARTPLPAAGIPRSNTGTPASQRQRDLPPSYDVSRSHTQFPSTEDVTRSARSDQRMVIPPPVRMAGHSSPRVPHGRELSSDSVLAAQHPMVATSIYYS